MAITIRLFGNIVLSLYGTIQQQAFAVTSAEIEEKYLKDALNALQNGNTTGTMPDILAVLDWEFKEVHPRVASYLGNVTASRYQKIVGISLNIYVMNTK